MKENMLLMHFAVIKHIVYLIGVLIYSSAATAQTSSAWSIVRDSLPIGQTITDQRALDSMELALLKTTKTYQQIERLLASIPPGSTHLDLLPSVFPIDVPVQAFRISSAFGTRRHPIRRTIHFHNGLDVKAPVGMIVKATAAGIVKQVGDDPNLGAFVRVVHAFGFETTYGHLSGYCVQPGQKVDRNQEIGQVGQTGRATGPHLHYTLKKNGSVVDPFDFCFLLRRRLWFQELKSKTSGASAPDEANTLSSKGE